jgi:hypothetical protein
MTHRKTAIYVSFSGKPQIEKHCFECVVVENLGLFQVSTYSI